MNKTESVQQLTAAILAKRPILASVFKRHASVSVREYSAGLKPSVVAVDAVRKREFIGAVSAEISKHFPLAAESAAQQLESQYMVSTAEHHGPLTHPFFVHSNL